MSLAVGSVHVGELGSDLLAGHLRVADKYVVVSGLGLGLGLRIGLGMDLGLKDIRVRVTRARARIIIEFR
jgi:hypothetical protein